MPKNDAALLCLEFEDNHNAFAVFGDLNKNLNAIEKALEIRIDQMGNRVELSGREKAIQAAAEILNDLYHRVSDGQELSIDVVKDSLKLAQRNHKLDSLDGKSTMLATKKLSLSLGLQRKKNMLRHYKNMILFLVWGQREQEKHT